MKPALEPLEARLNPAPASLLNNIYNFRQGQPVAIDSLDVFWDTTYKTDGKDHPLVVLIHGGFYSPTRGYGWGDTLNEDKGKLEHQYGKWLLGQGYVVVGLNYGPNSFFQGKDGDQYPMSLADIAGGIAWSEAHAKQFGGDAKRVVLFGQDTGANFAAVLASHVDPLWWNFESQPARHLNIVGVVTDSGYYKWADVTGGALKAAHVYLDGDPFPGATWTNTEPVHWVHKTTPPMLLIQGTLDSAANQQDTNDMAAALQAKGVAHRVEGFPLYHDGFSWHFNTSASEQRILAADLAALGLLP